MAPWRFPGWYPLAQAVARALGWLADLVTIVLLGFVATRWPDIGGAVAPGMLATAVALLTDSWQAMALADTLGLWPMPAGRAIALDMFALATSLGGVILTWLLGVRGGDDDDDDDDGDSGWGLGAPAQPAEFGGGDRRAYARGTVVRAAMWCMISVVCCRLVFTIWGCWDCYVGHRRLQRSRARRSGH